MNIVLVHPNIGNKNSRAYRPKGVMEPLALAVIAGMTPREHRVTMYDDRIEEIRYDGPADLVGISVETFTAKRAYAIADGFQSRGIPVVLGGYHPTALPEEALGHADAVVRGEAEGQWERVINDAQAGRLARVYENAGSANLAGYFPDRSIFSNKPYVKIPLVYFSRGCTVGCNFCALSCFYKNRFNKRPVTDVVAEIRAMPQKFFFFVDDNIAIAREEVRELFKRLVPLKKTWAGQISINHLLDEDFIRLMAQSGCRGVLVGIESLKDRSLQEMDKGINANKDHLTLIRRLSKHGIMHWASFVFGYDHDEPADVRASVDFTLKARSCLAAFNHLTPYPGTGLYDKLAREKRFACRDWWINDEYRFGEVPFTPVNFGRDQLSSLCFQARKRFNSIPSIFRRGLDFRANLGRPSNAVFYFLSNLVSGRDGRVKQGMKLG